MKSEAYQVVETVFCDMLERLAFLFGDPIEKHAIDCRAGGYVRADIDFSGPEEGHACLAVPTDLCREIAANVLGCDDDETLDTEGASDALKELLNVTCGHILTTLRGTGVVFDLSSPDTSMMDDEQWRELLGQPETVGLNVESNPVLLNFRFHH